MVSFCLAQLYEPVRVPRAARFATKTEVYAHLLAHRSQAINDHRGFCIAELGFVICALVDAGLGGMRVEVEGQPGRFEGVIRIWVCSFVECNPPF